MKKLLSLLLVMSVLVSVGGVLGANQNVYFTSGGVVNFSVNDSLTFPSVKPGEVTHANSIVTLGETNTENLTVEVYLTDESDNIFTHIVLTTIESWITGLELGPSLTKQSGTPHIFIGMNDTDEEGVLGVHNGDITATLTVPKGTLPTQKVGTIVYSITAPPTP